MLAALDAGAEDIVAEGDTWQGHDGAHRRHGGARRAWRRPASRSCRADLTMLPTTLIELAAVGEASQVLKVIDALDDHDDVQGVYANFDVPDSVMEELDASV